MDTKASVWEAPGTFEFDRDREARVMADAAKDADRIEARQKARKDKTSVMAVKHLRGLFAQATEAKARARNVGGLDTDTRQKAAVDRIMAGASKELGPEVLEEVRTIVGSIIVSDSGDLGHLREVGLQSAMRIARDVPDTFETANTREDVDSVLDRIAR
jgi:hypothetical protein